MQKEGMSLLLSLSSPLCVNSTTHPELHRTKFPTRRYDTSFTRLGIGTHHVCKFTRRRTRTLCTSCSAMPTQISSQVILEQSRAYWISKSLIAWNVEVIDSSYCYLYSSSIASLSAVDNEIEGHDLKIKLECCDDRLPEHVTKKFPHLRDYKAFKVPPALDVEGLLKCQLSIAIFSSAGDIISATGMQLPGVIDELFSYTGPLGAIFSDEAITFYLWAPTAQSVDVLIYGDPFEEDPINIVQLKEINGVWTVYGPRSWEGCYYVYEISVYHPSTLRIERCLAVDPYARGLSADGKRTLLVNIDSDALKPEKWEYLADEKPDVVSFSDISIYELHIRDFSASDYTVDPDLRGGYLAFTSQNSAGINHLRRLSKAGITHLHLLPAFQFDGVYDEKDRWKSLDTRTLELLPPDSAEQQEYITAIQNEDGYNWGYNPVLWGVPKGSYASNPYGPSRTIEFRKMVQALNRIGLRVVLDVVYNHLQGCGPFDENSVLDKIVPGYYLRMNTDGNIEHSTCMNNTASEHFMVERLIVDDLLCWAIDYK